MIQATSIPHWAISLDEITKHHIRKNLREYYEAKTFKIPAKPCKPQFVFYTKPIFDDLTLKSPFTLEEYSNYTELKPTDTEEEFQEEILNKSVKMGIEIAHAVDFLIREHVRRHFTGQRHDGTNWKETIKHLWVSDLFSKEKGPDDSYELEFPNLNLYFCQNFSTIEVDSSYLGWVAYKFFFACGFGEN
jgi:hypothetical protein